MSSRDIVAAAPKVELHVHLDGAFDTAVLFRAAQQHLAELPEEVRKPWDGRLLHVRRLVEECGDDLDRFRSLVSTGPNAVGGLFPVLDCFYTFLPIVRGRFDVLEELAYEFCRRQSQQRVAYTEVRYSPHEFLPQGTDGKVVAGASPFAAVEAVCHGLRRGQEDFGIIVRQILCCIAAQPTWSSETADLAARFQSEGVVGVDVASGEMHFEAGDLREAHAAALASARAAGLGVTVHAGEAGPAEHVAAAVEEYGAKRIGHGYRCLGTEAYGVVRQRGTHLELCPTSSVATCAVDLAQGGWKAHPAVSFCGDRCSCSVSTDDPAVFGVSLTDELATCVDLMGLTLEDVEWMTLEALRAAFNLEPELRERLEAEVRGYYDAALRAAK